MSDEAFSSVFEETVNDDEAVTATDETTDEVEETTEGNVDESTDAADQTDDTAETEGEPDTGGKNVPLAALTAEQRKRREAREALEQSNQTIGELKERLRALESASEKVEPEAQPEDEEIDFFADPDAAIRKLTEKIEQANARADEAELKALTTISMREAKKAHADFDETMDKWAKLKDENPALLAKVRASDDPAEEAYKLTKQAEALADPELAEAQLRERLLNDDSFLESMRQKLLGNETPASTSTGKTQSKPTNLADARTVGGANPDDPVDDINEDDFDRIFA